MKFTGFLSALPSESFRANNCILSYNLPYVIHTYFIAYFPWLQMTNMMVSHCGNVEKGEILQANK